jgi:transcriptional regulator with XRE-family HTH domain
VADARSGTGAPDPRRSSRPPRLDILLYIESPGDLIHRHRLQLGLSQRSLARRAGTTQAAVSRIERGLTTPTWETVRALLLAMGFEPELRARRLRGRWDSVHLAALRERSPAERLELAISANRLAGRLRHAGREASGGSRRAA